MPARHAAPDDSEFRIGNLPEGLNVTIDSPPAGHAPELDLKQDITRFGLAGKIWQSAYQLHAYFSRHTSCTPGSPIPSAYYRDSPEPAPTQPYRILELGAGTGYVGIGLANRLRKPCEVIITDLEQVLPLIRDNVRTHHTTDTPVRVQRLHWGNLADIPKEPIDLVIMSDCVFFPELFGLLTDTLRHVCTETTQLVIGYKCRSLEKEMGFWQDYLGRYFSYEPVYCLEKDEQNNQFLGGLLGEEEESYVFLGKRRPKSDIRAADDTFTMLMFNQQEESVCDSVFLGVFRGPGGGVWFP